LPLNSATMLAVIAAMYFSVSINSLCIGFQL